MFGCIVAGRPVVTEFQQADPAKYLLVLPDADTINHIVVFLTAPLPSGFGASLHFCWPGKPWNILGMLSNEKPSAVFKVGGKKALDTGSIMLDEASSTAQLGVSIEPMDRVLTAVSSLNAATPLGQEGASSEMVLSNAFMMSTSPVGTATKDPSSTANRILENLYNYCTSFATSTVPLGGAVLLGKDLSNSYIPVKAIQDWYTTLQRKLSLNPSYFEQEPPKP